MKITFSDRLFCVLIICTLCRSCKETKHPPPLPVTNDSLPGNINKNYSQAYIYCWCFESDSMQTMTRCTTPYALHPDEIMNRPNLRYAFGNKDTVSLLKRLLFAENHSTKDFSGWVFESRFLLLFQNSSASDTIVYYTDSSFIHKNKLYSYPFNMIDSIKSTLGIKSITCMDTQPQPRQ